MLAVASGLVGTAAARTDDKSQPPDAKRFAVGVATRDVTPKAPTPMWGYGARHAALSKGTMDPLMAKAIVIHAGDQKLAIVGTDLGRGPTQAMMAKIRSELQSKAGIEHVMISGSHSHHGPVIELVDREGFGRGTFDGAVEYSKQLPDLLIEAILEADGAVKPAKLGVATKSINYNRNRHSKRVPKATEPMLAVMRFDGDDGKPIAVLVNFAAHPTMIDGAILQFSADYPGAMKKKVEQELSTHCVFMQGSAGDMSANPPPGTSGHVAFGESLADQVLELARSIETAKPERPGIRGKVDHMRFASRVNFSNPLLVAGYGRAFFPELVQCFMEEWREGVTPELVTVLLNEEIALVGASGEFFANHSNRLKERSYVPHTLFFGYCNGHHMYFPTIEAVSEGGYGADQTVSPVEIGAGERMMNQALVNIYALLGKFPAPKANKESAGP
ncbi:MAG: neutral/alkaline non-lysosomal ceramidase N-terminal domain-containing protein [Planctomycetia bacterium]|nr:neutral/alkaline non-lysosomal ceramidase N-terminal domain-containing protein [Planctomycetia bacterium]